MKYIYIYISWEKNGETVALFWSPEPGPWKFGCQDDLPFWAQESPAVPHPHHRCAAFADHPWAVSEFADTWGTDSLGFAIQGAIKNNSSRFHKCLINLINLSENYMYLQIILTKSRQLSCKHRARQVRWNTWQQAVTTSGFASKQIAHSASPSSWTRVLRRSAK